MTILDILLQMMSDLILNYIIEINGISLEQTRVAEFLLTDSGHKHW